MKYTKVMDVKDPCGNRREDAGIDFFIPNDWNNGKPMLLRIGEQVNIPTGIKIKLKANQCMIMENKSGVALKKGVTRGSCVIDSSYRGVIHVDLHKGVKGTQDIRVRKKGFWGFIQVLFGIKTWATVLTPGEKIIQGIIYPISTENVDEVTNKTYDGYSKTERGEGGFGSTGTK